VEASTKSWERGVPLRETAFAPDLFFSSCPGGLSMLKARSVVVGATTLVLLVTLAFAGTKIKSDFDQTADFSAYKTYAWGKNLEPQRPGANIVLKGAVDYELQTKGLREQEFDQADLIVRYQVAGDSDMNFSTMVDPTYAMIGGIPWPGTTVWTPGFSMPSSGRYIRKGGVVIDIFDRKQHKLIWTATATGALSDKPKKAIEEINDAVSKMFTYYPEKKKS
jgi:hypothetical protein